MKRSMRERSGAGVILSMDAPKILAVDVRVDLCSRDVGMPKHFLDRAQICATLQEMRGERVAECMGRDVLLDSRTLDVLLKNLPRSHAGERLSAGVEEQDATPITLL